MMLEVVLLEGDGEGDGDGKVGEDPEEAVGEDPPVPEGQVVRDLVDRQVQRVVHRRSDQVGLEWLSSALHSHVFLERKK